MTKGGPVQVYIPPNMSNKDDDPIFSVSGDIAINWWYALNGNRLVLTGGYLSPENVDDDNTHGFGVNYSINGRTGGNASPAHAIEITNIQNCSYPICLSDKVKVQGIDHGYYYKSGPKYGNYAIYVSQKAISFPTNGEILKLYMNSHN